MAGNPGFSASPGRRNGAVMASVIGGLALVVVAAVYFGMQWLANRAPGDDTQTVVQHASAVRRAHPVSVGSSAPVVANVKASANAPVVAANAKPAGGSPLVAANASIGGQSSPQMNAAKNAKAMPGAAATAGAKTPAGAGPAAVANAAPNVPAGRTPVAAKAAPHAPLVYGPENAPAKAAANARVTPASPVAANAPAASAAGAHAGKNALRVASTAGTGGPVVTAVTSEAPHMTPQMAHLDEHTTYQYNALGRRDPFQSLVSGEFVGNDVGGDAPPDMGGIKVVGIVWGATDQFAMVEDARGNSYVLRKGDKVQNGVVTGLKRDAVIVNITADGQSQEVSIPLTRKGDQNAH